MLKYKILSGLLAVSLVFSLSGCKTGKNDSRERFNISVYNGGMQPVDGETPVKNRLEEKTGVDLTYIYSTYETRNTKLDVMISSGKTPDLFTYGYTIGEKFNRLIQQNVVAELTPYIEDYPNIKKRMEEFETVTRYGKSKNYFIPVKSTDTEANVVCEHAWFYRSDVVEELGLKLPTNADELYSFLKALKQYQIDNGQTGDSPLTLQSPFFLYCIYNLFGTDIKGVEEINGQMQPTAVGDKMKQAVLYIRKLYSEGLLDREFMLTPDWEFMFNKFLDGKALVLYTNYKYDIMSEASRERYPQRDPQQTIAYMPVMYNNRGYKSVRGYYNYFGGLFFKKEDSEEKMRKKLELVDYMLSDEGMTLLRYGIEGIHYEIKDGKPVSLLGRDKNGVAKTLAEADPGAGIKELVMYDVLFRGYNNPCDSYINEIKNEYLRYAKVDNNFIYTGPPEQMSVDSTALEEFAENSMVTLITTENDFDAEWDKYCRKYMEKGGAQLAEYAAEAPRQ